MKSDNKRDTAANRDVELRKEAETQLEKSPASDGNDLPATADALVHELHVHQIELEIQNEELQRSRRELEFAVDRYAHLYDFAPVGFFTFSPDGVVLEANLHGAQLLGITRNQLVNRNFSYFLDPECRSGWIDHVSAVLQNPVKHTCELTVHRPDGSLLAARLDSVRTETTGQPDLPCAILSALFDITEQKRAERDRGVHAERVNELSRRVAATQEDERQRLSGQLHDRTSPNLAALKINLVTLAQTLPSPMPAAASAIIADANALIDDATASVREISADLRPPLLDYAGLLPALESYGHQFARRTGINVSVDGSGFRIRPTPEQESSLFRIAAEALTNCAKHSLAKRVAISLANIESHLLLTITDDGIGFDPSQLHNAMPGHGLITMRERAEFSGGSFHLNTAPGEGTRIEVCL